MFTHVLKPHDDENDNDNSFENNNTEFDNVSPRGKLKLNKGVIKNKIKFMAKMLKMQKTLREEHEHIIAIKKVNDNKLPQGLLMEGKAAIQDFKRIKLADLKNEQRPY